MWLKLHDHLLANLEHGTFLTLPLENPKQEPLRPVLLIDVTQSVGLRLTPIFLGTEEECQKRLDEFSNKLDASSDFARFIDAPLPRDTDPQGATDLPYDGPAWLPAHALIVNPRTGHSIAFAAHIQPGTSAVLYCGPGSKYPIYTGPHALAERYLAALAHYLRAGPLLPYVKIQIDVTHAQAEQTDKLTN